VSDGAYEKKSAIHRGAWRYQSAHNSKRQEKRRDSSIDAITRHAPNL
jgi:hypothetical protein